MLTSQLCLIWITLVTSALSWNLTSFAPQHTSVGQVAVWRNRAFICLPRYEIGTVTATLVQAPWAENVISSQQTILQPLESPYMTSPRVYPRNNPAFQKEGYCPHLQNVTALDIDSMRGRLWVLDAGTKSCSPKVVVIDLRMNEEISKMELKNATSGALSSIAADPVAGVWGSRAYVADPSTSSLLVVDLHGWWRVGLDVKNPDDGLVHPVRAATLALSRREPVLYLTAPDSDRLYSLDVSAIRASPQPTTNEIRRQSVTFVGLKLGPSRGLVVDLWAGLHYFLPRDHASVRWDTKRPMSAESHSVLLQSSKILPFVSHMFLDSQWQVWAVVGQHCVKIQKYSFL
ncbi:uncharacterized protein [Periplaneta americana]|uniref:uncharacterized protein n=1 Tax=Periplaneta americana TaxID=6978 RepID=UPI0037E7A39A